jgi:DNA-binding GntR family transcriptional regulator
VVLKKEILDANEKIKSKLEMVNSDKVLFLQRVRYVNEEPVIMDETYLSLDLYEGLEEKTYDKSLYSILEENYNIEPFYSKGKYNIRVSGEEESEILNLKLNTPLLVKKAVAYTKDDIPIEYNITNYRTDKFEFVFESKCE